MNFAPIKSRVWGLEIYPLSIDGQINLDEGNDVSHWSHYTGVLYKEQKEVLYGNRDDPLIYRGSGGIKETPDARDRCTGRATGSSEGYERSLQEFLASDQRKIFSEDNLEDSKLQRRYQNDDKITVHKKEIVRFNTWGWEALKRCGWPQRDMLKYISSAVENNRVSHAYILNGERGSGKKMLANLFAMTLCVRPGTNETMWKMSFLQAGREWQSSGHYPCDT